VNRYCACAILSGLILSACGFEAAAADGAWLKRQIEQAKRGATVQIPAGVYDVTDLKVYKSLNLVGAADGKTVLRSAEVTEKGLLIPQAGVDLRVENLTFEGAHSWDRNGAGIRHEGGNLTVVNCAFIANEDGILATGSDFGTIVISKSRFIDNGFGDGYSHAIYIEKAEKLDVSDSRFEGTRIGHHVKSLASETIVRSSVLDDAHGRASYAVDASKGGLLTITGNTIVQSKDSDNEAIVNYDVTRGGSPKAIVISGNKIVNRYDGGVFLRNDTKTAPTMAGNTIVNEGGRPLAIASAGSPKPAVRD